MIMEDVVRSVNKNLQALKEAAIQRKSDPVLIEALHQMIRVTDVDLTLDLPEKAVELGDLNPTNENKVTAITHAAAPHPGITIAEATQAGDKSAAAEAPAGKPCADGHKNLDPWGKCKDCGTCTHPDRYVRNGVCITCDAEIK